MIEPNSIAAYLQLVTAEMLVAAKAGDWETLAVLEGQRRPQLEQFFSNTPTQKDQQNWRDLGEQLLALDREIVAIAQVAKNQIADSLKELNTSQKATAAYQDIQPR